MEFQSLVPAPEQIALAELGSALAARLRMHGTGAARDLSEQIAAFAAAVTGTAPAVHGDFWSKNILFTRDEIAVIDWETLAPGFPLQDAFTVCAYSTHTSKGAVLSHVQAFMHVFFSDNAVSRLLTELARRLALTDEQLRLAFYGFVGTRILFETGTPAGVWAELLGHLSALGYPPPFSSSSRLTARV